MATEGGKRIVHYLRLVFVHGCLCELHWALVSIAEEFPRERVDLKTRNASHERPSRFARIRYGSPVDVEHSDGELPLI